MPVSVELVNSQGESAGTLEVSEALLGQPDNPHVVRAALNAYLANQRQGSANTRTRSQTRGGGAKPFRQKGTGRARAGSRRSPIRVGGGLAFPPKPRDHRQRITKSMRRQALKSALLSKFRDDQVTVIEPLSFDAPKTKRVASMLKALGIGGSCLLAVKGHSPLLHKSSRNIPRLRVLPAGDLNALEVIGHKRLVLTREVVEGLAEVVK